MKWFTSEKDGRGQIEISNPFKTDLQLVVIDKSGATIIFEGIVDRRDCPGLSRDWYLKE